MTLPRADTHSNTGGCLPNYFMEEYAVKITNEQLACEYNYYLVQKLLKKALSEKLITVDEFNKISEKNRLSFSPTLAEIMPNTA